MSTDLAGNNLTELLTGGADPNATYTNSSTTAVTLTLENVADAEVTEAAGAIDQTAGQITLTLSGFVPGSGPLVLNGANAYSGRTVLEQSEVELGAVGALGSGEVIFQTSSELDSLVAQTLNNSIGLDSGSSADFCAATGKTLTLDGAFSFASGATPSLSFGSNGSFFGTVDLEPTGVQGLTTLGSFNVDGGTLIVGNSEAAQLIGAAQSGLNVSDDATLDLHGQNVTAFNLSGQNDGIILDNAPGSVTLTVDNTVNSTFDSQIEDGSGTIALVVKGKSGVTLTLFDDNTYSGGTTIDSGALAIGDDDSVGSGGVTFAGNGATLDAVGSFNFSNAITVDAGVSADIGAADDQSLSLDSSAATAFSLGNGATLNFGAANDTGAVFLDPLGAQQVGLDASLVVDGGFLLPQNEAGATMIGEFADVTIGTAANAFATIDMNGFDLTLDNLSGNQNGIVQNSGLQAAVLTLDNSTATAFDGNIHDGGGGGLSVVIEGSGTLLLEDDNTWLGGTTIDSGALAISQDDSVGSGGVTFAGNGATLYATAKFNFANAITVDAGVSADIGEADGLSTSLDSNAATAFSVGNGATLDFGSANYEGVIYLDPLGAQQVGVDATLVIEGGYLLPQDVAGATMIDEFADVTIGTSDNALAFIDMNGFDLTLDNLSGNQKGNIQNSGAEAVLIVDNTITTIFDGSIQGGGGGLSLVMEGSGELVLEDDNTWLGGTTIEAGATLSIGGGGTTGSIEGAVLDKGELIFWHSDAFTFAGDISGAGSVAIRGPGVTTLRGANKFTGGIEIAAGVLDLASKTAAGKGRITFLGIGTELRIEHGDIPVNRVAGLAEGDCIDLVGVEANSAVVNTLDKLVLSEGGSAVVALQLAGDNAGLTFSTLTTAAGTFVYADVAATAFAARKAEVDLAPNGFAVVGASASLDKIFAEFGVDRNLALAVVSDSATLRLSASEAAAALGRLRNANGATVQVVITDSAADVAAEFSALAGKVSEIAWIAFTDKTLATVTLTAAQHRRDTPLLTKIAGKWVLEVDNPNSSVTTVAYGSGLTIDAIDGVDTLRGAAGNETYVLKPGFGHAILADFDLHFHGAGHDFVDLAKSEFANFAALLGDATRVGSNLVISADGDTLTLDGMTRALLQEAAGDFKFM